MNTTGSRMDMGSVFRAPAFKIEEIGPTGLRKGVVRCSDSIGLFYDFRVKNTNDLPSADKYPNLYQVIVNDPYYSKARIQKNPETKDFPLVGDQDTAAIPCELRAIFGIKEPPQHAGMASLFNDPTAGRGVPFIYNTCPTMSESDPAYDSKNVDQARQRAVATDAILTSTNGLSIGRGKDTLTISSKSGTTNNTETQTNATQETNVGGGLMSTSPNFLQHYLIGMCNAVALPMPHMVNLMKMLAIGKFVKTMIGNKGKRVTAPDGTSKWESGTGIYGLGDEVTEVANK